MNSLISKIASVSAGIVASYPAYIPENCGTKYTNMNINTAKAIVKTTIGYVQADFICFLVRSIDV